VRRNVIAERYGDIVAALDRRDTEVTISTTVTYQDGSTVERKIPLRILDLSTFTVPQRRGRRPVWSGRR
jgi:long-chain acyl-CoA synthetase